MLASLYLASIFIQLTSTYFWCALFIVFLIICSEFVDAFVLCFSNQSLINQNLRFWDSEGLKFDGFWIFTQISKFEQLYLLFASIKTSVFMLVWKSSRCSLRKYIDLCTLIIVIECYSFSKIEKNSKNSYFFILFHFQHPHTVPKPYWYVLKMAFHIVFQVSFMFPEAETLKQAHSAVTRT